MEPHHGHPAKMALNASSTAHPQALRPTPLTLVDTPVPPGGDQELLLCTSFSARCLSYTLERGRNLLWQVRSVERWSQGMSLHPLGVGREKQAVIH